MGASASVWAVYRLEQFRNDGPRRVQITFVDRGVPYNPVAEERPDVSRLPKVERPLGGLGLFMVKKTMDEISYSYQDGQNVLSIRKRV